MVTVSGASYRSVNDEATEPSPPESGLGTGPRRQADPPLLIGGLLHQEVKELIGVGVDFLTVTVGGQFVPDGVGQKLLGATEQDEQGLARPGFAESEKRKCVGGFVWRRWSPRQPSKLFGVDYESWEASGAAGGWMARWLRGRGLVSPSRVDVNFDFAVRRDFTACRWLEAVRPHLADKGLTVGVSGDEPWLTRYVGARSSEKRIRVYRKDQEDAGWSEFFGPTLRVELILRGDAAKRWWLLWDQDEDLAKRSAATMIRDMTGFRALAGDRVELPEAVTPEGADEARQLALWVDQNGQMVAAWIEAGIDLVDLCKRRAARANRMGLSRMRRRIEAVRAVGAGVVEILARRFMRASAKRGGPPRPAGGTASMRLAGAIVQGGGA